MPFLHLLNPLSGLYNIAKLLVEGFPTCAGIIPTFLPYAIFGVPNAVGILFDVDVIVVTDTPEDHDFDLDDALAALVIVPSLMRFGDFFEMTTDGDLSAASGDAIFACFGHEIRRGNKSGS